MCNFFFITEARELAIIRPSHKKQIDSFDRILKCITHLIYLMLQTIKNVEQMLYVKEHIKNLIRVNPKSIITEDTLLHLCVSKLNTLRSSYFVDEDPIVSNYSFSFNMIVNNRFSSKFSQK